jgi:uncharacterized phage protein gp47/JayE
MSFPLATLAPTISATGITTPTYADILASLQASFRLIYGADAYLEADSQDGQLLAIFAQALDDSNQAVLAAYNNWSPVTAQGEGLSNVVKVNGIARLVPTFSQVNVTLTGAAGTVINSGRVADAASNQWALPAVVTIPAAGVITVTATAEIAGATAAPANTVTTISTPTAGWQSVTNAAPATAGSPTESDAALRRRQRDSTSLPALTVLASIYAAVAAIPGVTDLKLYENDTSVVDANGLPDHSIAVVVKGGDSLAIGTAIMRRKTPGAYTHGTTSVLITDSIGITREIRYFVPTQVAVRVALTIRALAGYTAATGTLIRNALAAYVTGLEIGQDVVLTRLYIPAQLAVGADGPALSQYEVTALTVGLLAGPLGNADVVIAFNEDASLLPADVVITVI